MTFPEFELHRPRLARQLAGILSTEDFDGPFTTIGWDITPSYENDVLFVAKHTTISTLVCVSPKHPMAMYEEESPGEPTWWWESDLA